MAWALGPLDALAITSCGARAKSTTATPRNSHLIYEVVPLCLKLWSFAAHTFVSVPKVKQSHRGLHQCCRKGEATDTGKNCLLQVVRLWERHGAIHMKDFILGFRDGVASEHDKCWTVTRAMGGHVLHPAHFLLIPFVPHDVLAELHTIHLAVWCGPELLVCVAPQQLQHQIEIIA